MVKAVSGPSMLIWITSFLVGVFAGLDPAQAEMVAMKIVPISSRTAIIFQFSDRIAPARMCDGESGHRAFLAMTIARNLDPRTGSNYGDGCWFFTQEGDIAIRGRAFHDGTPMILSFASESVSTTPAVKAWYHYNRDFGPEDRKMIDRANDLSSRCRGGSGDDPATHSACEERDETMVQLESKGICWGPEDAPRIDQRWIRC